MLFDTVTGHHFHKTNLSEHRVTTMADNMHPFDESRVINKFIQKTTILNFILTVNFVCEQKQSINGIFRSVP